MGERGKLAAHAMDCPHRQQSERAIIARVKGNAGRARESALGKKRTR
jgi:hypothetical protein